MQCLDNQPVYGGLSFDASCADTSVGQNTPIGSDVAIQWFEEAGCGSTHTTVVLAPRDTCHVVPNSDVTDQFQGYQVTCDADNAGGTFSVCTTAQCGQCDIQTPFRNGQCLPNPPVTGSASVRFSCAIGTANGGGGGGGLNPISGPGNSTSGVMFHGLSASAAVLAGGAVAGMLWQ
jgi:hypothetical protein